MTFFQTKDREVGRNFSSMIVTTYYRLCHFIAVLEISRRLFGWSVFLMYVENGPNYAVKLI